jgi:hypothetical protein
VIDRTADSPAAYRIRTRDPDEVDLVVLHQTGTGPLSDATAVRVKAHALVLDAGEVVQLHPWLSRMRWGSGPGGNGRGVNVEIRANLPGRYVGSAGRWWRPDLIPPERWDAAERRAQVFAARDLLRVLRDSLPALRYVCPHRTLQKGKGGCCGPDLWREAGEWAIAVLGLELLPAGPRGSGPPPAWRTEPTIWPEPTSDARDYRGPLGVVSGPAR